jgi:3-keto-disaccharide hydrolase
MNRRLAFASAVLYILIIPSAFAKGPAYTDPDKADADFEFQGEYVGMVKTGRPAVDTPTAMQVIALGGGKFHAVIYDHLPGDGSAKQPHRAREADGELKDGVVTLESKGSLLQVKKGNVTVTDSGGTAFGSLKRVLRTSPSLGAKPPAGAVVLFDGKSAGAFENGKMTDDGLLIAGCTSKRKFGSCRVHIEFRLPYMPEERGQARGNSGIYLQGRYEVQMLDSFGLEGKNNECGGLYELKDPDLNMCFPPLSWQTYDIDYTAAKYDGDKVVAAPRITVEHNGVVIHKDVELPSDRGTRAAPVKPGPEPGPIYLQDHGNPARYRNIWVVETK